MHDEINLRSCHRLGRLEMHKFKAIYGQPAEQQRQQQEELDQAHARRLFGDEVREPLIVNAELGIYPIADGE